LRSNSLVERKQHFRLTIRAIRGITWKDGKDGFAIPRIVRFLEISREICDGKWKGGASAIGKSENRTRVHGTTRFPSGRIRGGGCTEHDRGTHGSARIRNGEGAGERDGARACSLQLVHVTRYVAVLLLRQAGRCASAYAPWPIVGRGGVYHVTWAANRSRA